MKTSATRFAVLVNGELLTDATVGVADQLEINLASVTGQDGAVLAVTAFLPDAPKRDSYVHTRDTLISPGDTVTISLEAVKGAAQTHVKGPPIQVGDETSEEPAMICSFCGKTNLDVEKIVAGTNAFICNECVAMCHEIVSYET
jgi:hypothetical protein